MAAGVADARQRVVLGVEDDEASVVTAGRDEVGGKGRVEAIGARRDGDAEGGKWRGGEQAGEGLVGVVLVVGELWVGVDLGVGRQSTRPRANGLESIIVLTEEGGERRGGRVAHFVIDGLGGFKVLVYGLGDE